MTPRKYRRGGIGPSGPARRGRRRVTKTGKGGACSFAIPAAAASLLTLASQALAIRWQTWGAK